MRTQGPRVRVVQLDPDTMAALATGDLAAARARTPVPLSDYLAGPECRRVWRRRVDQVTASPADAAWVTGVLLDDDLGVAVGRAGFHGAPDVDGMVEVGYSIDPDHRRRGCARAALEALLARAVADPEVRTLRVTVSPDNEPSLGLVRSGYGLVEVGEQWDDEDGLELIFEVEVGGGLSAGR